MTFKKLVNEYKELILNDPITMTEYGIHTRDHELSDLSEEKRKKDTGQAEKLLKKLNSFSKEPNFKELSFEEEIDMSLMKLGLKQLIFYNTLSYNGLKDYEQKPSLGDVLIEAFLYLFLKDPRDSRIRLNAINSRFSKIPNMIKTYGGVVKKPIKRWKNIELEELNEIPDLFNSILEWAKKENYSKTSQLKKNIGKAKKIIDDYIRDLDKLPVGENFVIAREDISELIHLEGMEYNIEEIYNIAKEFFEEHRKKIHSLCNALRKKYGLNNDQNKELSDREVLDFIKNKFSVPIEKVIPLYRKEQKRIINFLKKADYFVFPKSDKLLILKTPKYLVPTIPVGAMFCPAPFENGPKTSTIYLTIDKKRKKDQNSLMITNTMIHEGIPGHHLQYAVAYENKSIPRKLADFRTHAEGWTTYLEDFMSETGFIKEDIKKEYLLIAYSDFARLGARVAIDLFFMTGNEKYLKVIKGFTPSGKTVFEKAKSLLQKATGFTDARCEGELNWYSRRRGYPLCYLLGNKMVKNIKKQVLESYQDKEKATKLFHKEYLMESNMPLPFLRKILIYKGIIKTELIK